MVPMRAAALVFYGATGDLAYKKIFPALHAMAKHGNLTMPVIGVAKSGWTLEQLRARAKDSIEHHGGIEQSAFATLMRSLSYIDGDYGDTAMFGQLATALGESRCPVHYMAIPPSLFGPVLAPLGRTGCSRSGRAIIEKPFGHDLATAEKLNQVVHATFPERDVFRIDHYLGMNAVQNLLGFGSATCSRSRSGVGSSSRAYRSRWRSRLALRAVAVSTIRPAPFATWFRTTCSSC